MKRPVAVLLTGSAGAAAIAYLAQPVLTRLYGPEAFGQLDLFLSALTLLVPVASLRYEDAIMLPEKDADAGPVLGLSVVLMGVVVFLCGMGGWIVQRWGGEDWGGWLLWLAPGLLLMRAGKLAELWVTRQRDFGVVSRGQMAQAIATTAARMGAGAHGMGAAGLIGGYLLGQLVSAGMWVRAAWMTMPVGAFMLPEAMRQAARRYRQFPLYSMPATLLNALVTRLPFLLFAVFFDATVVGYFGRAFALLAAPLGLVGAAFSQVFFVEGAGAVRAGTLAALTARVHRRLVLVGFFPTAVLILAGPPLVALVFGAPWRAAGGYLQVLAPWFFLASVASALTRVCDITEQQRMDLLASVGMFVVQTTVLVGFARTGDLGATLLALGIAGALTRWAHVALLLRLAGVSRATFWGEYARAALFSAPFMGAIYLSRELSPVWAAAVTLGAALGYYALVWLRERRV